MTTKESETLSTEHLSPHGKFRNPLIYIDMERMASVLNTFALACGFYLTMAGSAMAILARDLGEPVTSLALIGSMYGMALIVHGCAAPFTLRYGPVWLLRIAPILVIAGLILLVWCPNLAVVLVGAMLAAIGTGSSPVANGATFPGREGVSYMSIVSGVASATSIATTVIFAVFEKVAPGYGRFALVLMMIPSVVMLVWAWRLPAVSLRVFLSRHTDPRFIRPSADGVAQVACENEGAVNDARGKSVEYAATEVVAVNASTDGVVSGGELNQCMAPISAAEPGGVIDTRETEQDEIAMRSGIEAEQGLTAGIEQPTDHKMYSHRVLIAQVVRIILIAGVEYPFYAWSVEKIMTLGEPVAVGSAFATAFAVGMAVGRIFGARLLSSQHSLPVFLVLGIIGSVLTGCGSTLWLVTAGLFISGLGVSGLFPIGMADFSSIPGIQAHKASGIVMILSGVGGLVMPLLLGILLPVLGIEIGFACIAALFVLLAIIPRPFAS